MQRRHLLLVAVLMVALLRNLYEFSSEVNAAA